MPEPDPSDEIVYRPLPGNGLSSWTSLFLGPDHVLMRIRAGWNEEYRRFYLRDLQAVVVRQTARSLVWTIVLACLLAAVAILVVMARPPSLIPPAVIFLTVLGLPLLVNIVRGTTCECHLQTAVRLQRLPSIRRMPTARKFLAALSPAVAEAQGRMPTEEFRGRLADAWRETPPAGPPPGLIGAPARIRHEEGSVHLALRVVLLVGAGMNLLAGLGDEAAWVVLSVLLFLTQLILAIVAAVRQAGTDLPTGLRVTAWLTIAYLVVLYLLFAASGLGGIFTPARRGVASEDLMLVSAVWAGAMGLAGCLQLAVFRGKSRRRGRRPPTPGS